MFGSVKSVSFRTEIRISAANWEKNAVSARFSTTVQNKYVELEKLKGKLGAAYEERVIQRRTRVHPFLHGMHRRLSERGIHAVFSDCIGEGESLLWRKKTKNRNVGSFLCANRQRRMKCPLCMILACFARIILWEVWAWYSHTRNLFEQEESSRLSSFVPKEISLILCW